MRKVRGESGVGENNEARQVEFMQKELKRIKQFAQQFAKTVVDWAKMQANIVLPTKLVNDSRHLPSCLPEAHSSIILKVGVVQDIHHITCFCCLLRWGTMCP